jgi:hypothetical protein
MIIYRRHPRELAAKCGNNVKRQNRGENGRVNCTVDSKDAVLGRTVAFQIQILNPSFFSCIWPPTSKECVLER